MLWLLLKINLYQHLSKSIIVCKQTTQHTNNYILRTWQIINITKKQTKKLYNKHKKQRFDIYYHIQYIIIYIYSHNNA